MVGPKSNEVRDKKGHIETMIWPHEDGDCSDATTNQATPRATRSRRSKEEFIFRTFAGSMDLQNPRFQTSVFPEL